MHSDAFEPGASGAGEHGPSLRLLLLGGFQVERHGQPVPEKAWQQRRTAKSLIKLLAIEPTHSLHREQVLEYLWPEVEFESALNSFGKALHAARHALEPELPRRGTSSFLHLTNDILTLDAEDVWIDVDQFNELAGAAIRGGVISALEAALAAYTGELLPEDRYEDWAAPHRDQLAELEIRLLLELADAQERRGAPDLAIERLNQVLQQDPLREEVYRRLMRLYAESGSRHQALRQYQACLDMLRRELDAEPEAETEALYQDILAGQIQPRAASVALAPEVRPGILPPAIQRSPVTPLFGRERVLQLLMDQLAQAEGGDGGMTLVSGETGVGKTRLVAEVARAAAQRGMLVLWGGNYEQEESLVPYGPFVEALEGYVGTRSLAECQTLAAQYPELVRLIPSLARGSDELPLPLSSGEERGHLFSAILRLLTDLATTQPVLLVLDDLHAAYRGSLQLLQHLARLASQRRWLIIGTYREEDVVGGTELQRVFTTTARAGLSSHINLRRLARQDCDRLVRALLPNGVPAPELLEQVYALSLGNPLFVHELVGAMRGRGELGLVDGFWRVSSPEAASVPRQVQRLVDVRMDGLQEETQRVLSLVAAAGSDISFPELRGAAGTAFDPPPSEEELLDTLDRALQAGILTERGSGYGFEHPLFQAALYQHLSRPRRARLHAALARAIEESRPNEVEALAYHYSRSSDHDKAIVYLERASDRARSVGVNQKAEGHLRELVDRLDERGDTANSARVRQKLATVLVDMAEYDRALLTLQQAAEIFRRADDGQRLDRVQARIQQITDQREGRTREPNWVRRSLVTPIVTRPRVPLTRDASSGLHAADDQSA